MWDFQAASKHPKIANVDSRRRQKELRTPTTGHFSPRGSPGRPRARPESRKRPVGKREKGQGGKRATSEKIVLNKKQICITISSVRFGRQINKRGINIELNMEPKCVKVYSSQNLSTNDPKSIQMHPWSVFGQNRAQVASMIMRLPRAKTVSLRMLLGENVAPMVAARADVVCGPSVLLFFRV